MNNYVNLILLFFTCCFGFQATAQFMVLNTETHQSSHTIDLVQERLSLLEGAEKTPTFIRDKTVGLVDGELIINYQLNPLAVETGYYEVSLKTVFKETPNGPPIALPLSTISGDLGNIKDNFSNEKIIIWSNLMACLPTSIGFLEINLSVKLWGERILEYGVQCDNPPLFGFKQQLPYFATGVTGLAGLLATGILKGQAKQNFEAHLEAKIIDDRTKAYKQYEKNLNRSEILFFSSLGLLAIDAFFYVRRRKHHAKRVAIFEKHCRGNSFQISPQFNLGGHSGRIVQSNIQLKVTF